MMAVCALSSVPFPSLKVSFSAEFESFCIEAAVLLLLAVRGKI